MLIILAALGVSTLVMMFPVENYFVTFESPTSAFNYVHADENVDIVDIVDGKKSSMIVYLKDGAYSDMYVLRAEDGYKLVEPTPGNILELESRGENRNLFFNNATGTHEYFFMNTVCFNGEPEISDSNGTQFTIVPVTLGSHTSYIVYGYVGEVDANYYLTISSENIGVK